MIEKCFLGNFEITNTFWAYSTEWIDNQLNNLYLTLGDIQQQLDSCCSGSPTPCTGYTPCTILTALTQEYYSAEYQYDFTKEFLAISGNSIIYVSDYKECPIAFYTNDTIKFNAGLGWNDASTSHKRYNQMWFSYERNPIINNSNINRVYIASGFTNNYEIVAHTSLYPKFAGTPPKNCCNQQSSIKEFFIPFNAFPHNLQILEPLSTRSINSLLINADLSGIQLGTLRLKGNPSDNGLVALNRLRMKNWTIQI